MCGLTGFWEFEAKRPNDQLKYIATNMANRMISRGPDSSGVWSDEIEGLAFAHRRLSIQDLSEQGHQPMISHSGRFVTIYNGEIYNSPALRADLQAKGARFRGHSDTEVLLEAWEEFGPIKACENFYGMFGFAIWDSQKKSLFLVRDRLGVKPLYWGFLGKTLFFGSTLKSFLDHPNWAPKINRQALDCFLRLGYVPGAYSIFENIFKVLPSEIIEIQGYQQVKTDIFWTTPHCQPRMEANEQILQEELESILYESVKCRLLSDVPLGAFLSGGVDSSMVVALMQQMVKTPVKTFSIGFHEQGYNEAPHAKAVANHLGTDHHEYYATSENIQTLLPEIPHWYDEPFADSSQIPTYLVSRLARQHVTVALSGDGGDELFAGYNRYLFASNLWQKLTKIPYPLRCCVAWLAQKMPNKIWSLLGLSGPKKNKTFDILSAKNAFAVYKSIVTQFNIEDNLVRGSAPFVWPYPQHFCSKDLTLSFQQMDITSYLPDDILVKVDRASMAVGLEAREPLLDHRLIEFAFRLPEKMKIRNGETKWLLKQILYKYVPRELIERPKMGFGLPLGQWLRGPLKSWAGDLLSDRALQQHGLFYNDFIQKRFDEHCSGNKDFGYSLWNVIMFQAWYQCYGDRCLVV